MARIFCIVNQKGGVGKTTTAITLSDGLAKSAAKTLLIDLDPQCNATSGLGFEPTKTKSHPLVAGTPLAESVLKTQTPHLDLLSSYRNLGEIEALLQTNAAETKRIQDQLEKELQNYDYVFFDCPPSLGHLTQIALSVSTETLIPIQCEFFAMEGLTYMVEVIGKIMKKRPLEFGSVLMTMYDASLDLTHEVDQQVRDFFGEEVVFKTVVPRDVAFSEASSHGKSILDYAPRSRGARAYVELCMEILNHRAQS